MSDASIPTAGESAVETLPAVAKPVVFISYGREDRPIAEALSQSLDQGGIGVWRDLTGLRFGDTFAAKISRAIDECAIFLVIVSRTSMTSEWVESETAYAVQRGKPILPIFIEDVDLKGGLALYLIRIHKCDAFLPFEPHLAGITAEVRRQLSPIAIEAKHEQSESQVVTKSRAESGTEPLPRTVRRVGRPARVAVGVLAILAIVSILAAASRHWMVTDVGSQGAAPAKPGAVGVAGRRPSPGAKTSTTMVEIPGGSFMLGRDDGPNVEHPAHLMEIAPFSMDASETTNEEYAVVHAPDGGASFSDEEGRRPVGNVSWTDADAFCRAVGKRLPTEAEWEYAARAGKTDRLFTWDGPWRDGLTWSNAGVKGTSHTVKGFAPNELGLYDLLGNVLEWTSSPPTGYPGSGLKIAAPASRVIRGGHSYCTTWTSPEDTAKRYTTYRTWKPIDTHSPCVGFRCVRDSASAQIRDR